MAADGLDNADRRRQGFKGLHGLVYEPSLEPLLREGFAKTSQEQGAKKSVGGFDCGRVWDGDAESNIGSEKQVKGCG